MVTTTKTYRYTLRGISHTLHTTHRLVRAKSVLSAKLAGQGHDLSTIRAACSSLRLDDSSLRR